MFDLTLDSCLASIDWQATVLTGAGLITAVSLFVGGAGFLWGKAQRSINQGAENQELLRTQGALETANANATAWKESAERKDFDIAALRQELAKVRTDLSALAAKVETYEAILSGKDPGTVEALLGIKNEIVSGNKSILECLGAQAGQLAAIEKNTHTPRRNSATRTRETDNP